MNQFDMSDLEIAEVIITLATYLMSINDADPALNENSLIHLSLITAAWRKNGQVDAAIRYIDAIRNDISNTPQ